MITSCAPRPFMRSKSPSPRRSSAPSTFSAGNLFGTTRTSHPGVFGEPPFWRADNTSGGVNDSRPGQNGQCARPIVVVRSTRKSFGRFWRSVEMMTQRPVTGSRRSSGIEGVLENLDRRTLRVEVDGDDVEAAASVEQIVARQVVNGDALHAAALAAGDRIGRLPELVAVARLHLDEHRGLAVAGNDVHFSIAPPIASLENCVPEPAQLTAREILPVSAKRLPGVRHGAR